MTGAFLQDAAERAAATAAQAFLAVAGVGALDVLHFSWTPALSVTAGAALLSLVKSVAALKLGPTGTASLAPPVTYDAGGRHEAQEGPLR